MGILGVTDTTKVKSFSNLPEVVNMDTGSLQKYIDRAEWMASRLHDYDSTLPSYSTMMEYAVDLLVENLVIMSMPAFKRSSIAKVRAEQIGSYSYSRSMGKTGDVSADPYMDEIMMILNSFKYGTDPKVAFSTTEMFLRHSISVDSTGRKYYVPEDARVAMGIEDPSLPIEVTRIVDSPL